MRQQRSHIEALRDCPKEVIGWQSQDKMNILVPLTCHRSTRASCACGMPELQSILWDLYT